MSDKTAIISLYNINWLAFFVTEMEFVYCAARNKSLNVKEVKIFFLKAK